MQILNLEQGSPEWLEARAKYNTASEAPAMMGLHPSVTRGDLLRAKFSGAEHDVSRFVQERIFDRGHESEAAMRPHAEAIIADELFPCTVLAANGRESASLDGMTMDAATIWEHKQFNQAKVDHVRQYGSAPESDYVQIQQQLMITGARRCLYTVGNNQGALAQCWVTPNFGSFDDIRTGWTQFEADLAAYVPPEFAPEAVGRSLDSLPALRIEVTGMVTASNLAAYKAHAIAVFKAINTDLQNDQDFADAEATVKWCQDVENRLDAAKQHALSQTESIDELLRTIDDLKESARQKRLELDRLVKARKVAVRDEIRMAAEGALAEHLQALEARLDRRVRVPRPDVDFGAAMKNKRTIASLRDAVDQVLAGAKILSSARADAILINIKAFDELAGEYRTLFPDLDQLVQKFSDDFTAAVKMRISDHVAEQERRAAAKRAAEQEAEARRLAQAQPTIAPEPVAPVQAEAARPAPGIILPAGRPVQNRVWRLVATFEVQAPANLSPDEVAARLKARLAGFDSLVSVAAESSKAA